MSRPFLNASTNTGLLNTGETLNQLSAAALGYFENYNKTQLMQRLRTPDRDAMVQEELDKLRDQEEHAAQRKRVFDDLQHQLELKAMRMRLEAEEAKHKAELEEHELKRAKLQRERLRVVGGINSSDSSSESEDE
jgi:hypothetical protein